MALGAQRGNVKQAALEWQAQGLSAAARSRLSQRLPALLTWLAGDQQHGSCL